LSQEHSAPPHTAQPKLYTSEASFLSLALLLLHTSCTKKAAINDTLQLLSTASLGVKGQTLLKPSGVRSPFFLSGNFFDEFASLQENLVDFSPQESPSKP
jgi:hypothetical protein